MANGDHLLSRKGREEKVLCFKLGKLNTLFKQAVSWKCASVYSSCFCSSFHPLSKGISNDALLQTRLKGMTVLG